MLREVHDRAHRASERQNRVLGKEKGRTSFRDRKGRHGRAEAIDSRTYRLISQTAGKGWLACAQRARNRAQVHARRRYSNLDRIVEEREEKREGTERELGADERHESGVPNA